jgi:type II secretory pathway component PulM
MFLGQITTPLAATQPNEAIFFYLFIGACSFILLTAVAIVTIWALTRRSPSIDSEFATKKELHAEVARLGAGINELDKRNESRSANTDGKLELLKTSVDNGMREVHRALGRLEGPGE